MRLTLTLVFGIGLSLAILSCGGGGSGGGGETGGATSTIRGNVADVLAAAPREEKPSILAKIRDFFVFSDAAVAQSSGASGIEVAAEADGTIVDSDVTGGDGGFELTVPAGADVTLVFDTGTFEVSIEVFSPESGVLSFTVSLSAGGVVVEEAELDGTISCDSGFVSFNVEGSFVITNQGFGACLSADGNCTLIINSEEIVLDKCVEACIKADDTAEVMLTATDGDFTCSAQGDGISVQGSAHLNVVATSGDIDIQADEDGVMATDASRVSFIAGSSIVISGDNGIIALDSSTVELDAEGECTIEGTITAVLQGGISAILNLIECTITGDVVVE